MFFFFQKNKCYKFPIRVIFFFFNLSRKFSYRHCFDAVTLDLTRYHELFIDNSLVLSFLPTEFQSHLISQYYLYRFFNVPSSSSVGDRLDSFLLGAHSHALGSMFDCYDLLKDDDNIIFLVGYIKSLNLSTSTLDLFFQPLSLENLCAILTPLYGYLGKTYNVGGQDMSHYIDAEVNSILSHYGEDYYLDVLSILYSFEVRDVIVAKIFNSKIYSSLDDVERTFLIRFFSHGAVFCVMYNIYSCILNVESFDPLDY